MHGSASSSSSGVFPSEASSLTKVRWLRQCLVSSLLLDGAGLCFVRPWWLPGLFSVLASRTVIGSLVSRLLSRRCPGNLSSRDASNFHTFQDAYSRQCIQSSLLLSDPDAWLCIPFFERRVSIRGFITHKGEVAETVFGIVSAFRWSGALFRTALVVAWSLSCSCIENYCWLPGESLALEAMLRQFIIFFMA